MTSTATPILDPAEPESATTTAASTSTIRVLLPGPLRALAHVDGEIPLEIGAPSQRGVIDALETRFPQLKNTLRDAVKDRRRPKIRFYACGKDLSHTGQDDRLPEAVLAGTETYLIVGAISGG
ncbi:MAG: MoaD/ThiS family protein [Thermomicrobiales bacterium]